MSQVVLMTATFAASADVLPSLALLAHRVRVVPADVSALVDIGSCDVLVVDARVDLAAARTLCRLLPSVVPAIPVLVVLTEGGFAAVSPEWSLTDVILQNAGPAEVEARLRLAVGRGTADSPAEPQEQVGDIIIDEAAYTARLHGAPLDLTYKEFELLKYLVLHPGRVFTRAQLLHEVWGYDYYGGTRTVDVHVRRLRAKLGPEHDSLIGTVRNVGYRYTPTHG